VKAPKDKIMCGKGLVMSAPQVFPDIQGEKKKALFCAPKKKRR
jgi:hypothetical protein